MHHCFKPARTWFLVLSVDQLPISMFADCFFSRSHGTTDCSQPWVQNSLCPPILEKSWGRIEIGDYNKTKENVRWRTKQQRNLFLLVTWRTRMCGVCAYAQEIRGSSRQKRFYRKRLLIEHRREDDIRKKGEIDSVLYVHLNISTLV